MSKYIDAEKLIERLEEMKQTEYENCGGVNSKTGALQEVQELIESLQQEQPEVDLEKTIEAYFKGWHIEEEIGLTKPDGWSCIVDDLKDVARHFYELGLIARGNE